VGSVFGVVTVLFVIYFKTYFTFQVAWIFVASLSPVVVFFLYWFSRVYKDSARANFSNTMRLNFISATCLNGFFTYLMFYSGSF
jgi:1,4-dihydroxy-2-naphthoate octaprenyltransferase